MSLYNTYDNFYDHNPDPRVVGGRNRATQATRDALGRFQPCTGSLKARPAAW